ncbi:hypothetical protein ACFRAE_08125 [Sphingobacterium sp. HJSM2_6]|uniref:hypothetical protein n=1 Tax=Sphingobacterium sp. HJSM2_6 TaxID=3366264 RepID=UPI003BD6D115
MKRNLLILLGALLVFLSCDFKGKKIQAEAEKAKRIVSVNLIHDDYHEIVNSIGKAFLYVYPSNLTDISASKLAEVSFDTKEVPFSINFEFPKNHRNLLEGKIDGRDSLIYYVSLAWDSNGDGKIDSLDIGIDYDKQFPHLDLDKIDHQIYLK